MDQRGCRELRMQERDMLRPRHHYYYMGRGMGSGMGPRMHGGMGQGGMGN
jgi:hypothetical protein